MPLILFSALQEPKFVSGGDKAQKLVDLSNFSIYFDTELLGDLEGQALVVRIDIINTYTVHAHACTCRSGVKLSTC